MKNRRHTHGGYWQSYADLAMGLMSVLVFVLMLLLARQSKTNRALAEATAETGRQLAEQQRLVKEIAREREALRSERSEFAVELMQLIESTWSLVERQDDAETWLRELFGNAGCRLVLTEVGGLEIADASGQISTAANLYASGDIRLSPEGQAALASCRANFTRLSACLSPPREGGPDSRCVDEAGHEPDERERHILAELRTGLDGLVVEGSTDRFPFGNSTPVPEAGRMPAGAAALIQNYAGNSFLGAERARQAVVFLASLVAGAGTDEYEPLAVFLSRIRVESSSFGRFQIGPTEWREGDCDPESTACDAARKLAFRVSWKKSELRKPYEEIRRAICGRLGKQNDPFARGLIEAGQDLAGARRRYGCDEIAP